MGRVTLDAPTLLSALSVPAAGVLALFSLWRHELAFAVAYAGFAILFSGVCRRRAGRA